MTGCCGGALGAPLWVALLSVLSKSGWNGMECLGFILPLWSLLGLSPLGPTSSLI
jgi:hypothetical protein